MDWDAWIFGELSFPSGGVERWKRSRPRLETWAELPGWLRPTVAADARVSTLLANIKGWAGPLWEYIHAPDCVSVTVAGSSVSLRAYLTGAWFAHFAGQLVAATLAAADEGARGELVVADVRTAKGYLFDLEKGGVTISAVDLAHTDDRLSAIVEDSRGWIEGRARVVLPAMTEPHPERDWSEIASCVGGRNVEPQTPPHPLREVLLASGAQYEGDALIPRCFSGGEAAEVARAQKSCAVFDMSHAAPVRVAYNDTEGFLADLCGGSVAGAREVDLSDPSSGTFADRTLITPVFTSARMVHGSALDRGRLHDWLRARAAERTGSSPTMSMPILWSGPALCFVGPDCRAVAAEVLGIDAIRTMSEGDSEGVVFARRHNLPAVWAWLRTPEIAARCSSLFAGSAAEDRLDELAGARPRPRWDPTHITPWTEPSTVRIAAVESKPTKRKK